MTKKISVKCIKDLKAADIVLVKKGDVVDLIESEDSYTEYDDYLDVSRLDENPFARVMRTREINVTKYILKIDWLVTCFYLTNRAVEKCGGHSFDEYFRKDELLLTAENVERIHKECSENIKKDFVTVEGIKNNYIYDQNKIEECKSDIKALLYQLPKTFRKDKGGGWSFLNMCMREEKKQSVQWTGLHVVVEELMCLGIAAGLCKYLLPKDMWKILPGEMPYIVVE